MASVESTQVGQGKSKTLLCAVYTRKSTDENLNSDFTSLDSQREYCQAFIKSREPEGWRPYPERYDDPGFSGANMDRPGLRKLISDARQGKFHVVVCYKYDRLSRNTKDFLHILDIFDRHGVAFVSVTQPIDTTSSVGRLMRSILMDFAQFEREMISERTRDKMAAMARKGKRTGGYPIIGYDINYECKRLDLNPVEAEQVKEMFETYLKTRSLAATAQILNRKEYRMKAWTTQSGNQKGGQEFDKGNLWRLLRNPFYIGKITYKSNIFPGEQQAIISEKTFTKVQKFLRANGDGKLHRQIRHPTHAFLLKGLIRCTACQTAMTPCSALPRKTARFYYYKCVSVAKKDKSACPVRSVPAKAVEEFVIKRLQQLSENQTLVNRIVHHSQSMTSQELPEKREKKRLLASELANVELQAKNLVTVLAEEGPQSRRRDFVSTKLDELTLKRDELQSKLLLLKAEIEQLETRQIDSALLQTGLKNFLDIFAKVPDKEKTELIGSLVKEVLFDGIHQKVVIQLRPLPEVWHDVKTLEGVFYYRSGWGG